MQLPVASNVEQVKQGSENRSPVTPPPHEASRKAGSRRRVGLLLALLGVLCTIGLINRGSQIREWWMERKSTEDLERISSLSDPDPLACFLYAKRLMLEGKPDDALIILERGEARLGQDNRSKLAQRTYSYLGYLYARQDRSAKAMDFLKRASDLDEDDPLPHMGYGILFASEKMPKFAQTQFDLVTQLDPQNPEGWFRLGRSAMENLKAQQAVEPLKRAIELAPNDAASHAELGTAYAVQSQFGQAVTEFKRATQLSPEDKDYRAALANAMAMNARSPLEYQEAAELLSQVIRERNNDETLEFTLGLLHLRFNKMEEAKTRFQHCVVLRATDAEAWYNLSVVEQRLGNDAGSAEARKQFQHLSDARTETVNMEKQVGASPRDPVMRIALAKAYERAGNILGAYWQYRTATRMSPNDQNIRKDYERLQKMMIALEQHRAALPTTLVGSTPGPPPPPELLTQPMTPAPAAQLK